MSANPAATSSVMRRTNSPLLPDGATIERFLAHCHRRRYPSRTDVFRPGDPASTLYYIVSGSVSIITEEEDGRELVLGYFGPGEFVGELGCSSPATSGKSSCAPAVPASWPKSATSASTTCC